MTMRSAAWSTLSTPITALLLGLGALLLHRLLFFVLARIARRTSTPHDEALLACIFHPLRWIAVAMALLWTDDLAAREDDIADGVVGLVRIAMPLLWGWLVIAIVRFLHGYIDARSDVTAQDNLAARRMRTRMDILARIATIIVVMISLGLLLFKIPEVREIGLALVASAGLAGLAFGVAAQPLLKNLVAGIQLAFTEPVRIDDVVVYQGEWGRVEKISLTYVVIRIWDDRRLVIPVSKLLEDTVENWTRETSHLLGTVLIYLDHAADVDKVRTCALAAVRQHRLWDGRVALVQVTDMTSDALVVRILLSGRDGSDLFDLRCDVREAVVRFVAAEMLRSTTRSRVVLEPLETK
jgi:small-conductance mechanosensitive channel